MKRMSSAGSVCLAAFSAVLLTVATAKAQTPVFPDAAATDPAANGVMQGFPPPPDKTVRFADGSVWKFPFTRWSFSHERELVPTKAVSHGTGPAATLASEPVDLSKISFKTLDGATVDFDAALAKTYTDGFLVLHRGKIVFERYFAALSGDREHIAMSVTKSFIGTLAAMLVEEGKIDPAAPVTKYVPELANTAYGDATVREVMDMQIGVKYSENYADPKADIWRYVLASGAFPIPPGYAGATTLYAYLQTLQKEGEHGKEFAYKTVNAETLAWILKRATGQSLADLLSTRIWSKIGAEADAYFVVDPVGTEVGGGGLNTRLRDLARVGEMMRNGGRANGAQVLSPAIVADIIGGGDRDKFPAAEYKTLPGWSYRNMWWVSNNDHHAYEARGIYGQAIYIDPKAEMVIVRYASHPIAANGFNDGVSLPLYAAIAQRLMAK